MGSLGVPEPLVSKNNQQYFTNTLIILRMVPQKSHEPIHASL